jgi:hypothetical protein
VHCSAGYRGAGDLRELAARVSVTLAVPPMEGIPHKAMAMPLRSIEMTLHKGINPRAGVMSMDVEPEGEGMVGDDVNVSKEKVKEMVMSRTGGWGVVGISGMGGRSKTTLAMDIFRVQGRKQASNPHKIESFLQSPSAKFRNC